MFLSTDGSKDSVQANFANTCVIPLPTCFDYFHHSCSPGPSVSGHRAWGEWMRTADFQLAIKENQN